MKFPLCPPPLSFLACVGEPPMGWIRRNIGDTGLRGRSTELCTLWKFLVGFRLTAPHTCSCAGAWDPNELQGAAWKSPILCCLHVIICLKIKCVEHFPCLTSHFSIDNVLKLLCWLATTRRVKVSWLQDLISCLKAYLTHFLNTVIAWFWAEGYRLSQNV